MPHGTNGTSPSRLGRRQLTAFTPARTPATVPTGRPMPDRRALRVRGIPGAGSVAVGGGLLLAGLATLAAATSVVGQAVQLSAWTGFATGVAPVAAGLVLLARGRRGLSRRRRVRRLRARHPNEPWLWEHPWNAFASFDERGAELRLPGFPCVTGRPLDLKLVRTPAVAAVGALRATLRCLQERHEEGARGARRRRAVVVHALYEAVSVGEPTEEGEAIVFRFDLPAGLPGSSLEGRPPRYWEVEVEGETAGADFRARFLVPVYTPR
jgi:hypothetical protein